MDISSAIYWNTGAGLAAHVQPVALAAGCAGIVNNIGVKEHAQTHRIGGT
jgi:hypothetical protein